MQLNFDLASYRVSKDGLECNCAIIAFWGWQWPSVACQTATVPVFGPIIRVVPQQLPSDFAKNPTKTCRNSVELESVWGVEDSLRLPSGRMADLDRRDLRRSLEVPRAAS
jgi:hypothetical protein